MIIATAKVHPVYLMNTDLVPGGCWPSDQARWLWL